MSPNGSPLETEGVLNPGVTRDRDGRLLLFPRVVARGNVSRVGIARVSEDTVDRLGIVLEAGFDYERRDVQGGYGCEDARVTFVAPLDLFVMTYTAFGPFGARIALAVSPDAYTWTRLGPVSFADGALNALDNKDAAFFPDVVHSPSGVASLAFFHRPMLPETINGQTPIPVILALPLQAREAACIAFVPLDDAIRDLANLCRPQESVRVLEIGDDWGRLKNGAGTPPIRTQYGWLSVYHGVDVAESPTGATLLYSAGILINDIDEPARVLYRSPAPILVPQTNAEKFGTVNNVVFPTGIDPIDDATF
jgi:beta-1,2-mannobiose phosphorylase / 1,2-beta-oligomannan phosphorylase